MTPPLAPGARLLETLRVQDGRVALLDRHLARLAASADALGVPLHADGLRRRVESVGRHGTWGARLTVGADGDAAVEAWPLADGPLLTVWIDPEPLAEAGTVRCVHKTTDRAHYRRRYDRALGAGADEAVLVNGRGEVTEGTRTSVWALRDGRWLTPPLASGGLAGVMRGHLLDSRADCAESVLTPDLLRQSDALALSNALRGWMPVRLVGPEGPG